ncbi:hypothetical protein [Proteiniphilum sp.]|jgi:hypothetical protein|uniref:hypothetical protein n=1 Tax=Proteiniphilum sp. TaxID=1926877 RepID=UPI002B1FC5E4|nr:hypothetical protein [Proteiniphilum sp.]MEA5129411.1 hypothetical protein [Proteiniphilum sp.]
MAEKKNIEKEDEIIGQMMQSTKIQAPENLKYRIMQQIETEKALMPQKMKRATTHGDVLADFRGIFGTMYVLLFVLSLLTIIFGGKEAILSPQYILTALLIVITLSSFWALTRLDAFLRNRKKTK